MFTDNERRSKLPIKEFLIEAEQSLKYLRHVKDSSSGYNEGREIINTIKHRLVKHYNISWEEYQTHITTNDFHKDEKILDDFFDSRSDKGKSDVIEEFKSQLGYDLRSLIGSCTRNEDRVR